MAAKLRVLIVEDVEEMLRMIEALIQGMSHFSVSGRARNGVEARFETGRRRPDLVLLDEVLPGESSIDLLEQLRSEKMPVILMTSLVDRDEPLPPGARARILKPGWKSLDLDRARIEAEMLAAMR